ncbi:AAA family ATPase [Desulfosporosinus sp. BICA1-9]|uniref:AAA family ATPase n=1 Tax=Desulfosporosinus sp. BICA1-9 TaxID=1531958 RepID=UPI0025C6ADFB|nr:AAA family ATPase [Desulfosporosinus sp. BICA1-9]
MKSRKAVDIMPNNEFYIKQITLKNFRGFDDRTFELAKDFTVFVGDNGKGKTSVLEGMCVALGGWVRGFMSSAKDFRNIYKNDVRSIKSVVSAKGLIKQYPVEVACLGEINGLEIEWSRELDEKGHTKTGGLKDLSEVTKKIAKKVNTANDIDVILPVIAYYSCLRASKDRVSNTGIDSTSRVYGYSGSLLKETKYFKMLNYIQELRYEYLEDPHNTQMYIMLMDALTKIVESAAGKGSRVDFKVKHGELMLEHINGELIQFSELSDGYKGMISLVADIFFRMAKLNPQLKQTLLLETSGVVLIDELDLHLHPKWQRQVVGDLKKIFPKVQFVATTHSPFIIQSLGEGELVTLDGTNLEDYVGASIEDISEEVMGIEMPQYSAHKLEMYKSAFEYFSALDGLKQFDEAKLKDLKLDLDILSKRYGDNVAYYAFIEQKYYAKKAELEARR